MNTDTPTIAGYVLWTALIVLIMVLAHRCGALSDIEAKDPAEGSHIPEYIERFGTDEKVMTWLDGI